MLCELVTSPFMDHFAVNQIRTRTYESEKGICFYLATTLFLIILQTLPILFRNSIFKAKQRRAFNF